MAKPDLYAGKSAGEREHLRQQSQRARNRRKTLARYQLDPDDYERMLDSQGGVCAICHEPPPDGEHLRCDHCHESDRNRALLCDACNKALGFMRDSETRLQRAIDYVRHWRAIHARETDKRQRVFWD
jgi:hypothetical protein